MIKLINILNEIKQDNIFPNSKIKNIAYHDSNIENIQSFRENPNGIWFTGDKNWWQAKKYKYAVKLNIQNPYITNQAINNITAAEWLKDPKNKKYDALISTKNIDSASNATLDKAIYVVRHPYQIYIL